MWSNTTLLSRSRVVGAAAVKLQSRKCCQMILSDRVSGDFSWKEAWDMILRVPAGDLLGVSEGSDFVRQ